MQNTLGVHQTGSAWGMGTYGHLGFLRKGNVRGKSCRRGQPHCGGLDSPHTLSPVSEPNQQTRQRQQQGQEKRKKAGQLPAFVVNHGTESTKLEHDANTDHSLLFFYVLQSMTQKKWTTKCKRE